MKMRNGVILATLIAAATAAVPASAAVVISGSDAGSAASYAAPASSSSVINFNSGTLQSQANAAGMSVATTGLAQTFSGYVYNYNGTGNDFFQPEPSDGTAYLGVGKNSSYSLMSQIGLKSVSAFLGSLDNYNLVSFYDAAGAAIGSFSGQDIFGSPLSFPGNGSTATNRRVTFSATNGMQIFGVKFSNTNNLGSFEIDNIGVAAVPEPASWLMMIGGFAMIGASLRNRRKTLTFA